MLISDIMIGYELRFSTIQGIKNTDRGIDI